MRIPRQGLLRRGAVAVLAVALVASGCQKSSTPTSPSTPPATPGQTFSIAGLIYALAQGQQSPVAGALVEIIAGANQGRTATADGSGRYRFDGLSAGAATLRASAPGFVSAMASVTVGPTPATADIGLPVPGALTTGRVVHVLSSAGLAGIAPSGAGIGGSASDGTGAFTVSAVAPQDDPFLVTFTGPGVVTRQTSLRIPGPDALVSLIDGAFELAAFDEMFRNGGVLRRWTSAPPLVIESRLLQFTSVGANSFTAMDEALSDEEYGGLAGDLGWALPQLTGQQFQAFASVARQTADPGATVPFFVGGRITVARFQGLTAATGFWGYSRWQFLGNGTVTAGTIMLDRDFERSGSAFRRSLRAHELGHALGYNHVTLRQSVMNSSARFEPNTFDLDACRIGFARQPGNRPPDIDPSGASANRLSLVPEWSPPMLCGR